MAWTCWIWARGRGDWPALLAPMARSVLAFDLSSHMLRTAREKLQRAKPGTAVAGGCCRPPLLAPERKRRRSYRLRLECQLRRHLVSGCTGAIRPMPGCARPNACCRPGGKIILFESLGTGNESPQRLPHLERFYDWLDEKEFSTRWIRTDYRFDSLEQAEQLAGFFFGDEMKPRIRARRSHHASGMHRHVVEASLIVRALKGESPVAGARRVLARPE